MPVSRTETEGWWLDRMVSVIASSADINASNLDELNAELTA